MNSVIGVMSTFRPDENVLARAKSHLEQIDHLIIVDDGSQNSEILNQLEDNEFTLLRLSENSGIAAALNFGINVALEHKADFVITLDQDSILMPNYVPNVLKTFSTASETTRLGIVLTDCVNGQPSIPPRYSPEGFGLVDEGIQSGMVISKHCLEQIGMLDERLFIDCVDTEFCLRARDFSWNIAVAPGTNIQHSLGQQEPFKPFGKIQYLENGLVKEFQYHPPFRRYYITRNNLDLCIRNIKKRPRWVASVLRREFTPLVKVLLSGPQVSKQWLAFGTGTLHGIFRKRGKIPNWLAKKLNK